MSLSLLVGTTVCLILKMIFTCGTTGGVQGEDSLDGDVHGWGVEGLKHDLCHLFSVGLGVKWGFCEKDWVLFGGDTEFIVEGMMPDLLHIIPVCDDTVFNGVLEGEDTSLALGFISYIAVFLTHTNHHTLEYTKETHITKHAQDREQEIEFFNINQGPLLCT